MVTASQAIARECNWCMGHNWRDCDSRVCKLNDEVSELRSRVKRIGAHCLDCAGTPAEVKKCLGDVARENGNPSRRTDRVGTEHGMCWLHPFRFGRNPGRPKRVLSDEAREKLVSCLEKNRPASQPGGRKSIQNPRS